MAPIVPTVAAELHRLVATRPRKVLVAVTVGLGVLGAAAVLAGTPAPQRTFASAAMAAQLLMSVTVPFAGVLSTTDFRRSRRGGRLLPRVLAAVVLAVGYALVGVLITAVGVAVVSSEAVGGRWQHAGAVVLGSVLMQVIAQLTGTGWGLLLRSPGLAMAATIVVPLALWWVLGAIDPLRPAQDWLTPFASAGHLLSGQMQPVNWAQSLVVVLVWDVGLNALGARRRLASNP